MYVACHQWSSIQYHNFPNPFSIIDNIIQEDPALVTQGLSTFFLFFIVPYGFPHLYKLERTDTGS
jgi:hypothetical protein